MTTSSGIAASGERLLADAGEAGIGGDPLTNIL
jgi:hypothetical protein